VTVPLRRVLAEKRGWLMPLAAGLLVNLAVYGLAVYPLSVRVANAEARAERAAAELVAARRDSASAQAAEAARAQASAALSEFYTEVLPRDLTTASRITYLRLAQLARELNLRAERRSYEPEEPARDSVLGRLYISMTLAGDYADMRQFIYELETSPDFVVIEGIVLADGGQAELSQVLTLTLVTYYEARAEGTRGL
jgi:Tfp pilus assembly protein PilO